MHQPACFDIQFPSPSWTRPAWETVPQIEVTAVTGMKTHLGGLLLLLPSRRRHARSLRHTEEGREEEKWKEEIGGEKGRGGSRCCRTLQVQLRCQILC